MVQEHSPEPRLPRSCGALDRVLPRHGVSPNLVPDRWLPVAADRTIRRNVTTVPRPKPLTPSASHRGEVAQSGQAWDAPTRHP
jgi:hypothetical protein